MESKKTDTGYLVRLEKGESLVAALLAFLKNENVKGGVLQGIGGALEAEVGFYNLDKKEYEFKKFNETMEIASLLGNFSLVDNDPFLHIHVVLSDKNLATYAGHLKEATVAATCEVFIVDLKSPVMRDKDEETGLNLLSL